MIDQLIFEEDNFKVSTRGLFIGIKIKSTFGFSSENSWSEIENLPFWVIMNSPKVRVSVEPVSYEFSTYIGFSLLFECSDCLSNIFRCQVRSYLQKFESFL